LLGNKGLLRGWQYEHQPKYLGGFYGYYKFSGGPKWRILSVLYRSFYDEQPVIENNPQVL
jgi:hypothetical protein